jgi:hypothetical protein
MRLIIDVNLSRQDVYPLPGSFSTISTIWWMNNFDTPYREGKRRAKVPDCQI